MRYIEMHRGGRGGRTRALENRTDLYVNERQKIRHYRARSTEERTRSR